MAPSIFFILKTCALGLSCFTFVRGDSGKCGALLQNTNSACQIAALPEPGTVYYEPSDNSDITIYAQGTTCGTGSYADVSLYSGTYPGTLIADCGCLSLDGSFHTVSCPGIAANALPAGPYYFLEDLGAAKVESPFTIAHVQETTTVDGGTTTATIITTETDTETVTTTFTTTSTSPQVTVTSPAVTTSTTITISPTTVTTTLTSTKTYTFVKPKLTITTMTTTKIAPCTKITPKPCPTVSVKGKRDLSNLRIAAKKNKRDDIRAQGNGPPTITVTGAPTVVTEIDTVTTTETDTTTVTTSTTVQPTPLTTTSYTGVTTNMVAVTLPTPYKTRTISTTTKFTSTKTIRLTVTVKAVTTPVCK